ncbi:MAG: coproporphyrinogen III oxidase, partial [Leeuwenhoekiella sp.]
DLIFGLPFQTETDIEQTILETVKMRPDRISFYSYAHTPWLKENGQRGFNEKDVPEAATKRRHYNMGKKILLEAGYLEIGIDHFALPEDTLTRAAQQGRLHRNFMGYTTSGTQTTIGLGVSAISDACTGLGQNVKGLEEYHSLINNDILPIYRGHILTTEDEVIRKHILNLMCQFHTSWKSQETEPSQLTAILQRLREMEKDDLMYIGEKFLQITPAGRAFVRNACMAFDQYIHGGIADKKAFSMII